MTGLIVLVTSSLQPFESFLSFLISLFLCDDQTAAAHSSQPCSDPCCYCFLHHVLTNVEEWHSVVCASPLIIPKSIFSFTVSMIIPPILHASHGPFFLFSHFHYVTFLFLKLHCSFFSVHVFHLNLCAVCWSSSALIFLVVWCHLQTLLCNCFFWHIIYTH